MEIILSNYGNDET